MWTNGRSGSAVYEPIVRCRPITKVFGAASELGRSILAVSQPSSCRPTTDRGCKAAPFKELPLTAESGGATRAALLAMRAHRGTGSSNPLPSSGESSKPRRQMLQTRGVGSGKHPVNGARKALFTVDPGINNVIQIGNKIRALDLNAPGENGKSEQ